MNTTEIIINGATQLKLAHDLLHQGYFLIDGTEIMVMFLNQHEHVERLESIRNYNLTQPDRQEYPELHRVQKDSPVYWVYYKKDGVNTLLVTSTTQDIIDQVAVQSEPTFEMLFTFSLFRSVPSHS